MTEKSSPIIMYGRPSCPMIRPVQKLLDAAQAEFEYIDINHDEAGLQRVREINQGNESVPTLVFPDGSTLTEPGPNRLRAKLADLGYEVSPASSWFNYVTGSPIYLIMALLLILFILRVTGIF